MSVILGIDLGTSSVKAMLLDSVKGVISVESSPYEVSIPFEGYAEQNPETWWLETKQVLGRLRDKNEQEFNEIQAVGFSGQMHGIVVADCERTPLRPAILWLDQRSRKELESINSVLDFREMGEIFRNRAFTGFAFPSLMWLKEHEPEVLLKAGAVLMPKDYIRFRMTGNLASDVTDASATALFDTAKRDWAFGIIKKFGLPEKIFPVCKESMEVAGTVTRQCHEECGLKEGIPVVYGSGDQMAQSIGNGVFREGEVISNIGTGGQISAYIKEAKYDRELRTHTFCHALDKAYTIYGATLCSGMSLNWLKNKVLGIEDFNSMSHMAQEIDPGCRGLIFLPYLSGERTPHMNPSAKGMFFGLSLCQDRRYLTRAVMEGVTFSLRDSLTIFEELGIQCETVIASGGGSHSDVWLQIQADVFNKKVKVCEVDEQACLGACILAGTGCGIFNSIEEAARRFVSFREKVYEPIPEHVGLYEKQYRVFRELYVANERFMI